jgi:hypothetical protein
VVEVAGEADGEDHHAGAAQVHGRVLDAAAEALRVHHGGRGDQVVGGAADRRAQRHAPAVPVDEQHLPEKERKTQHARMHDVRRFRRSAVCLCFHGYGKKSWDLEKPLEEVGGERGAEQPRARAFHGARHGEGRRGGGERRGVGHQHPVPACQDGAATAPRALLVAAVAARRRGHVPELGVGHVVAAELGEAGVRRGQERHDGHHRHVHRRRRRVQEREPHLWVASRSV